MARRFEKVARVAPGPAAAGYARVRLPAPLHDRALLPWRFHAGLRALGGLADLG